jgi:CO dehydrogenase/acetyl-CoA synthase alpha subunit
MNIKDLTVEQFKALIEAIVEAKLEEILGDPDKGLEVREEIIEKLITQRTSKKKRIPMYEIEKELGIDIGEIFA